MSKYRSEEDLKLYLATVKCYETGRLTPLLKEELRCQIQYRRLSEGKDEMVVDFSQTPERPQQQLRPDEIEKKERRKEQNKKASAKLRQKRKTELTMAKQTLSELETRNSELKKKVGVLQQEKACLEHYISHLFPATTDKG